MVDFILLYEAVAVLYRAYNILDGNYGAHLILKVDSIPIFIPIPIVNPIVNTIPAICSNLSGIRGICRGVRFSHTYLNDNGEVYSIACI